MVAIETEADRANATCAYIDPEGDAVNVRLPSQKMAQRWVVRSGPKSKPQHWTKGAFRTRRAFGQLSDVILRADAWMATGRAN